MKIVVNGEEREVPDGATVRDVIALLDIDASQGGIAVAVNRAVRSRTRWDDPLGDGDRVEVLNAVQGGAGDPDAKSRPVRNADRDPTGADRG